VLKGGVHMAAGGTVVAVAHCLVVLHGPNGNVVIAAFLQHKYGFGCGCAMLG
jgi:hypothetical protein